MNPIPGDILSDDLVLRGQSTNDPRNWVVLDVERVAAGDFRIHEGNSGSSERGGGVWLSHYPSSDKALEALKTYLEIHPTYREFHFDLEYIGETVSVSAPRSDKGAPETTNVETSQETELVIENGSRTNTTSADNHRVESLQESLSDQMKASEDAAFVTENGSRTNTVGADNHRDDSLQESLSERMKTTRQIILDSENDPAVIQRWIHTKDPESVLTAPGSKIGNYLSYDPGLVRQKFAEEELSKRNWQRIEVANSMPGFGFASGVVYLLGGSQSLQDAAGLGFSFGLSFAPANLLDPRARSITPKSQGMSWRFKSPSLTSGGWRGKNKGIRATRDRNKTKEIHPSTVNEGFVRKINWPPPESIKVEMEHIMTFHHPTNPVARARLQPGKVGTSLWPAEMTAPEIEAVIRDAYRNIDARKSIEAGGQHIVQGTSGRFRVEMAVDIVSGTINTAYWVN